MRDVRWLLRRDNSLDGLKALWRLGSCVAAVTTTHYDSLAIVNTPRVKGKCVEEQSIILHTPPSPDTITHEIILQYLA